MRTGDRISGVELSVVQLTSSLKELVQSFQLREQLRADPSPFKAVILYPAIRMRLTRT